MDGQYVNPLEHLPQIENQSENNRQTVELDVREEEEEKRGKNEN